VVILCVWINFCVVCSLCNNAVVASACSFLTSADPFLGGELGWAGLGRAGGFWFWKLLFLGKQEIMSCHGGEIFFFGDEDEIR